MSAPHTDIKKQKRRHLTPLVGIVAAVLIGFGVFMLWIFDEFEGAEPGEVSDEEALEMSPPGSEDVGNVDVPEVEEGAGD